MSLSACSVVLLWSSSGSNEIASAMLELSSVPEVDPWGSDHTSGRLIVEMDPDGELLVRLTKFTLETTPGSFYTTNVVPEFVGTRGRKAGCVAGVLCRCCPALCAGHASRRGDGVFSPRIALLSLTLLSLSPSIS